MCSVTVVFQIVSNSGAGSMYFMQHSFFAIRFFNETK